MYLIINVQQKKSKLCITSNMSHSSARAQRAYHLALVLLYGSLEGATGVAPSINQSVTVTEVSVRCIVVGLLFQQLWTQRLTLQNMNSKNVTMYTYTHYIQGHSFKPECTLYPHKRQPFERPSSTLICIS